MASVIKDTIPPTLALSIVIDRARTYLLRARGHKQLAQAHARLYKRRPNNYHKGRFNAHTHFAREHRRLARQLLQEAERIKAENEFRPFSPGNMGARLLDGASFPFWPQYKIEMRQFGGDAWLGGYDARREPV